MKFGLGVITALLTVVFVAAATIQPSSTEAATTPEGAVQSLLAQIRNRNLDSAYSYVANTADVSKDAFAREVQGSYGSLRTNSTLQRFDTKVIARSGDEASVRSSLQWSTAVGAIYETRELKTQKEGQLWKVEWPVEKAPNVPPQVIPVTFLRWDVIQRGANDDFGAQNVEAPRVRVVSMNAVRNEDGTTVLGEVVNEDTVPAFVSISAFPIGQNGAPLGEESSFDKISHTLLPKEVSPFRIDFPSVALAKIKSVRIQPTSLLVGASADPVIAVLHQRLEKTADGHQVLKGELLNESGQIVNIPHVLATYYDNAGKVIWVSDGYVSNALLPQVPEPFSLYLRDDVAPKVNTYRVTVNDFTIERQGQ